MSRGNVWAVCRERGVILKGIAEHSASASRVRVTYARRTLRRLMDRHGEAHVGRVLDAILGDERGRPRNHEGNAAELYGSTLTAVSQLLACHPALAEGSVSRLFQGIDLGVLRRKAQRMKVGPVSQTMLTLLTFALVDTGADDEWIKDLEDAA